MSECTGAFPTLLSHLPANRKIILVLFHTPRHLELMIKEDLIAIVIVTQMTLLAMSGSVTSGFRAIEY